MPHPGKKIKDRFAASEPLGRHGKRPSKSALRRRHCKNPTYYRFTGPKKSRVWLFLLLIGLAFLLIGAALTVPGVLARAKQQKAENALQTLYYQAGALPTAYAPAPSASPLPSDFPLPAVLFSSPPEVTAPPLRSFATQAPWKINLTQERFLPLRKINKDVVGWLTIDNFLDLPVVQRDNKYYLTHDFYGDKSPLGTLFLDENYKFSPPGENMLIHGHNMRDGSMFGRLQKYAERSFYTQHWFIRFESLYESSEYAVFAAFTVSGDSGEPTYFRYAYSHFGTDAQFTAFMKDVRKRSVIKSELDVAPRDRLIMLSTCVGDSDYFVVIGRRVRDDETRAGVEMASLIANHP